MSFEEIISNNSDSGAYAQPRGLRRRKQQRLRR